ncbi:MAG TPA: amidohydrolase [Acidiphilium sp.]
MPDFAAAERIADTLTDWRHHLHQHPEVSLHEEKTAEFVCARLTELGIPFEAGIGGHGVVATLRRGGNRSVGLRADMDALPIVEATGLPYASVNPGVMHACGHDGHTTSLLGAAILLRDDPSWTGTVHLVFQPAEEGFGGARAMIADGLFSRFPMERIFGYHNWPGMDAGTVMVHDGPMMAQGERIAITIKGHAGHAAMPHLTTDPVMCAGHILVGLQSIVARNVNPLDSAVVSICMLQGAEAENQIPDTVNMRGTFRALKPDVFEQVAKRIEAVVVNTAEAMGCHADVKFERTVAATINHRNEAELSLETAASLGMATRRDLPPTMASEDFGWYLREIPGAYAWIGNGPARAGAFLHNQGYNFNDAILPAAATYLAATAKRALGG